MAASGPILLYDGTCGLCTRSVQFVLRHDRRGVLRFASLQGQFGQQVIARHPELRRADSVVWVEPAGSNSPERVATESDAVLRVLHYLGRWWAPLTVGRIVPRSVRDGLYRLVARHRFRLVSPRCLVPDVSTRTRFLDS